MNILLDGIFYNGHGFAEGNRVLLKLLDQAGHRVRIHARDKHQADLFLSREEAAYIASFESTTLESRDLYLVNFVGYQIKANPDFRVNIARTTFETDRIPESWVAELNRFDEIWVPSRFNEQTFRASGVKVPLKVVPNFMDTDQFDPRSGEVLPLPIPAGWFRFLSVFDLQDRKGYDVLIRAFMREFNRDDRTALVLKVRQDRKLDKLVRLVNGHARRHPSPPPVYLIDSMLPTRQLAALYRSCDAFVLPTRGEGWGRPFFEAMLMEMPTIGTDWSGQREFMNETNAFLVPVKQLVQIRDCDFPYFNGHYWAEPSVKDLAAIMRHVWKNRNQAAEVGKRAREQLLKRYSMNQLFKIVAAELAKYDSLAATAEGGYGC